MALAAALVAASAAVQPVDEAPAVPSAEPALVTAPVAPSPAKLVLPKGTMVRLMVTKEVNSRDHRAGHRFTLRVDEDVKVGAATLVPVGAKGWAELVSAEGTSGVGKSGQLAARLLYIESGEHRIPVGGERQSRGSGGTGQVVASVLAFGPLGLLMKGNDAKLKAGEILNGYTLADASFEVPPAAVR